MLQQMQGLGQLAGESHLEIVIVVEEVTQRTPLLLVGDQVQPNHVATLWSVQYLVAYFHDGHGILCGYCIHCRYSFMPLS